MASTIAIEFIDDKQLSEKVQEIVAKKEWMHKKRFLLIDTVAELDKFVEEAAQVGECVIDLETNGLNVGPEGRGVPVVKIAGFCLSYHEDYGVYVPVAHRDGRNIPLDLVLPRIHQLVADCVTIYHNFKYDGEILRNHGVIIDNPDKYHDTLLMIAVLESDRKDKGLKTLSKEKLNQEMIEINALMPGKDHIDFTTVHPKEALWYGASDGVCTKGLYNLCRDKMLELDPHKKNGIHFIYNVERACQLVVMEMERNLCRIDIGYYTELYNRVGLRLKELEDEIYRAAGQVFDINSIPQLGQLLFVKFGLPYPAEGKSKTDQFTVKDEILEKIKDKHPLPRLVQEFRELGKIHTTYLKNLVTNVDKNECVKFQLNQVAADSGRFSSKGGKGLTNDGYSGVNCQNIPAASEEDPWKLRKGIIPRKGYKICSVDYAGEELRITANMSKEQVWIKEFNEGTGDLHSITASLLFRGGTPADYATKKELKPFRKIGKTMNFLILYGGGAQKFSLAANISMQEATERLQRFFDDLPGLSDWMKIERIRARKRGYSLTAFGRRRPLAEMYASGDRAVMSKADRLAVNACIQGCLQKTCRILTNKGYLQIGDLLKRGQEGEQFEAWTGHSWAPFHTLERGECEVAEVLLANGHRVDCDTRHQMLVVGEGGYVFKAYKDLTDGDQVCLSPIQEQEFGVYPEDFSHTAGSPNTKPITITTSSGLWEELAWLSGIIIGDGTVRLSTEESVTLCFGSSKVALLTPRLKNLCEKLGVSLSDPRRVKGALGESYELRISSKALVELLKYMGHEQATSSTKRVPAMVWESPISMRKAFLRGYWDTDGSEKRVNRYSFHTTNYELLRDVAILGRSLGLDSRILTTKADTYRLDWSDLCMFEKTVGIPEQDSPCIAMGEECVVPPFMVKSCLDVLGPVYDRKSSKDKALLCKLRTGKRVLIKTVERLCAKYGVKTPDMYYTSYFKSKRALGFKETTYTLSVQDDGHRFDGDGVIHKNTGADVIKIALYRVWCYIRKNNLQDDIRILMPIHDEIVYEIREDKLDTLIPALCKVMKLDDLTQNVLKWPVKLEVDAEYGDNFLVKNNYFADLAEGITASMKMGAYMEHEEHPEQVTPESTQTLSAPTPEELDHAIKEGAEALTELAAKEPPVSLDSSEFFNYEIAKSDAIAKAHTDVIWCVLDAVDKYMNGPRKRIRLIKQKRVLFTTPKAYSIDGFLALAHNYEI